MQNRHFQNDRINFCNPVRIPIRSFINKFFGMLNEFEMTKNYKSFFDFGFIVDWLNASPR